MKKYLGKFSPAITLIAGIVAGVLLIFKPNATLNSVISIIGWGLIIAGALMAVEHLLSAKKDLKDYTDSAVLLVGGIAVLVLSGLIKRIVPMIIGVILLLSGLYKLKNALAMKKSGSRQWVYMAVMAALSIGFAIFVFCQPVKITNTVLRIIGVLILVECAEDLFAMKIF